MPHKIHPLNVVLATVILYLGNLGLVSRDSGLTLNLGLVLEGAQFP